MAAGAGGGRRSDCHNTRRRRAQTSRQIIESIQRRTGGQSGSNNAKKYLLALPNLSSANRIADSDKMSCASRIPALGEIINHVDSTPNGSADPPLQLAGCC